jgi:protein tyrosine/serine phosphatase
VDQRAIPADVSFSSVFNFRDLGGRRGADDRTVHYGRLYRSDSLHRLTAEECERLAALGIRTVLDLRRPYEIERDGRIRETVGVGYHNIHPIHREWNPARYDESSGPARYLADRYLDMAEEGIDGLGEALRMIADPDRAPLVMHCFAGKDRTGVLSALTLALLGVADEEIAADYALSEAAQVPLSAQIKLDFPETAAATPPMHFVVCPPLAMQLFLTELRGRYGSIPAYTKAAGVTDEHLAALRAHLLG